MAAGLRERHPDWEIVELPLADGGEGTLEALLPALGGHLTEAVVQDPLGRPIRAKIGLSDQTAIVEVAEACGLKLLTPGERNPLIASTYGVGQLLLAAREAGARHLLIGLGGTATCDGGMGMLQVPGLRKALQGCTLELLCDVDNPFVGPNGAARIFAPQKGASPADVEVLENRLLKYADQLLRTTGVDVRDLPGAGAAGGLGGALMACFSAQNVSGIGRILELLHFQTLLEGTDLIVSGEGKSDSQTLMGKVPCGVLRAANGVPVVLASGRIENGEDLLKAGFSRLIEISPCGMSLEEAVKPDVAARNILHAMASI